MHKPVRDTAAPLLDTGKPPVGVPHPAAPVSLEGIHSTVSVPDSPTEFWRNWRAYVGPALLVSVGYMDPGNWGTDLQAGSQFKYRLLWGLLLSDLMALLVQPLGNR